MNPIISETERLVAELRRVKCEKAKMPDVLVIEDTRMDAEPMIVALAAMGCRVSWAANGEDGLRQLALSMEPAYPDFDLIFLDLKLPGMDGVEVLRDVRRIAPALPVVIVTHAAYSQMIADAARLGYLGLIEKPLQKTDVEEILRKHRIPA